MPPRSLPAWMLTVIAVILTILVGATAYYMSNPVDMTGLGVLGLVGLVFSPQLLLFTIVGLVLAYLSRRFRASLAETLYIASAVLCLIMAIAPNVSIWQRARQYHVPVSFGKAFIPSFNAGGPSPQRTIVYGKTADGTTLKLDLWKSNIDPAGKRHPAMIRLHGGGWNKGERGLMGMWDKWFNEQGYDVFEVEYRMPPSPHWTNLDEVGDVKCAIGWVLDHATDLNIDTDRISLTGFSSGGNLALLAAYTMGDSTLPPSCPARPIRIRTVINFYGPSDLLSFYSTSGSPGYVQSVLQEYTGGRPGQVPKVYRALSPVTHISGFNNYNNLPPTITFIGEKDRCVPIEQESTLDTTLTAAGVHHELYLIPWADHGFDFSWNSLATQIARGKIQQFLDRYGNN